MKGRMVRYSCLMLLLLLTSGPVQAQVYETWLSVDGGYLHQEVTPTGLRAPVYQTANGFSSGLSLYYADQGSYHLATFSYNRQNNPRLYPADISSFTDRFLSLQVNYEYTYFHFRNVADLHLDLGSGPYLFVQNQITHLQAGANSSVENNHLLYGGGVNLVLRYRQPGFPLTARLNMVNGGFWGRQEVKQQVDSEAEYKANGWMSDISMNIAYRPAVNWKFYLRYNWSERLEYLYNEQQRRTYQGISLGISFRLEDD